jgi:hypothetical protein
VTGGRAGKFNVPDSWITSHRSSNGAEIVSSELAVQMKSTDCERVVSMYIAVGDQPHIRSGPQEC